MERTSALSILQSLIQTNSKARAVVLRRWARLFPGQPLPDAASMSLTQKIRLEENDPELFKVLTGAALAPDVEMALMDGSWPDEADPALTAAAKQKAAEEALKAQMLEMDEKAQAIRESRAAGSSAVDLEAIEASRQRGVEFARAAAGRRW